MIIPWLKSKKDRYQRSVILQNSFWGVFANILQIIFALIFFIIISKKYSPEIFARFLVSTTVYQLVAAFSTLGLGQWFIRQYELETNKELFTNKFLKTQVMLGIVFTLFNVALAYLLYDDIQILQLCCVLGINIISDNFIYGIRNLNIAENQQRKTAAILAIDGFLKLALALLLLVQVFSPLILAILMVGTRIVTVGIFMKVGTSDRVVLKGIVRAKLFFADIKRLVIANWQFMVIGSASVIYWKIGNIIISKTLSLNDVADYEIAFRIFSVLIILPVVVSGTIYPQFVAFVKEKNYAGLKRLYKTTFILFTLFAILAYAFVISFADVFIPLIFGTEYGGAIVCIKQMFLTFLFLPTVLLQANLIVALGLEKLDMWFNVIILAIHLVICSVGLYFIKDLSVVNYSALASFFIFHILQDASLLKRELISYRHCLFFYSVLILTVISCYNFEQLTNPVIFFISFSLVMSLSCISIISFRIFPPLLNNPGTDL